MRVGVLTIALMAAALAQDAGAAQAPGADQAVTSYDAGFFAASRPGDAKAMIDRIPGFAFDGGGSVRGLSGAAGNVLIDGRRPSSKSDSLSDVLARIPADQVVRIDVIRGGAPGIDMQRKPVVANVIRDPRGGISGAVSVSDQLTLGAGGRNEGEVAADVAARLGAHVFEAAASYTRGDAHDRRRTHRLRTGGDGRLLMDSQIASDKPADAIVGAAAYETALPVGDVRLNIRSYRETSDITERDVFAYPQGLGVLTEAYRGAGGEFGGRYVAPLGGGVELETLALRSWRTNETRATSVNGAKTVGYRRFDESGETVGRAVLRFHGWDALSLETGLEAAFNWLEGDSALMVGGVLAPAPGSQARVEERRGEGFATGVWQPSPVLAIEAGLRMEASILDPGRGEEQSLDFAKPSAALTWTPSPQRLIRVRIEREVGQLNFNDFVASVNMYTGVVTAGAGLLAPTQTLRAEVAFEQQFAGRGALAAILRQEQIEDVIGLAPVAGPNGLFDARSNVGPGLRQVLELNSTVPLDAGGISGGLLKAGLKAVRSEVTDAATGERRSYSGQSALEWNAAFTQDLPAWNATWGVNLSGATDKTAYRFDGTEASGAEPWASAFVDYSPRSDVTLRLEVNNLTARGAWSERDVHAGLRHVADLVYAERRDEESYRNVRVSLRKAFN